MSWLSAKWDSLTGKDQEWADQQNNIAAAKARNDLAIAAQAQLAEQQKQEGLKSIRDSARAGGQANAERYFTERGLDPSKYSGSISDAIDNALASVSPGDTAPGLYLRDIGQNVFTNQQDIARQRALRDVNSTFAPDFERLRITSAADAPAIADVMSGQRADADAYINNLLKRGVITKTGYDAGEANLAKQDPRVRNTLTDLGSGILDTGRQNLLDIANRAKTNASTLSLGDAFDPNTYKTEANTSFDDFMTSLGDKLKAQTPAGLYDTSGLASVAGAAQGAQNLSFDPNALAGLITPNPDEDPNKKKPVGFTF